MRIASPLAIPLCGLALACVSQAATCAPQAGAPQGLTVVRDAETGELRAPTATENQALQAQAAQPSARPAQPALTTGADGRLSVKLDSSHLVYSVVKRGADGKLDQQCVDGDHAAHAHIADQHPSRSAQEKARHDHR